jgi:hypothetical protein
MQVAFLLEASPCQHIPRSRSHRLTGSRAPASRRNQGAGLRPSGGEKLQAARSSSDNGHGRDPHPPRLRMLMQLLPVKDDWGRGGHMQVSRGLAHEIIGRLATRRGTKIHGQQGTWQRQAFLGWQPGHRH